MEVIFRCNIVKEDVRKLVQNLSQSDASKNCSLNLSQCKHSVEKEREKEKRRVNLSQ